MDQPPIQTTLSRFVGGLSGARPGRGWSFRAPTVCRCSSAMFPSAVGKKICSKPAEQGESGNRSAEAEIAQLNASSSNMPQHQPRPHGQKRLRSSQAVVEMKARLGFVGQPSARYCFDELCTNTFNPSAVRPLAMLFQCGTPPSSGIA